MSSKVLITDQARSLLEKEQERRINDSWKRGYSLEQIVSEAITNYLICDFPRDAHKDNNGVLKEEEVPDEQR